MPNRDGTGPRNGGGPRSGKRLGNCVIPIKDLAKNKNTANRNRKGQNK